MPDLCRSRPLLESTVCRFLLRRLMRYLRGATPIRKYSPKRRLAILLSAASLVLVVMIVGPRLVPIATANHTARSVQLNFPEAQDYPRDWFTQHASDLAEIQRLSLAPTAQHPDLLVWPEAPAPFFSNDSQFVSLASSSGDSLSTPFHRWRGGVEAGDRFRERKELKRSRRPITAR